MKIKTGDYVKSPQFEGWKRVSQVSGKRYSVDNCRDMENIIDITEVLAYGEDVMTEDDRRIFIGYNEGFERPFVCVTSGAELAFLGKRDIISDGYKTAKQIVKTLTIKEAEEKLLEATGEKWEVKR